MTVSFFAAALSAWRAAHLAVPDLRADAIPPQSVVKLSIKAVANARTADNLGAEREGTGLVFAEKGLILTIGYLILEADTIEVTDFEGKTVGAAPIAYDHATGFGLQFLAAPVSGKPLALGNSGALAER
ncbi:MAG: hypothetical protein ACREBP_09240, partial [Sphingomicrobium sp.]